jgi:hypothetical protein
LADRQSNNFCFADRKNAACFQAAFFCADVALSEGAQAQSPPASGSEKCLLIPQWLLPNAAQSSRAKA